MALVPYTPSILSSFYAEEVVLELWPGEPPIQLLQGGKGTGAVTWTAGLRLARAVAAQVDFEALNGEHCCSFREPGGQIAVELGCGMGLASIACAALGMRVIATDGEASVLEVMKSNICRVEDKTVRGELKIRQLQWANAAQVAEVKEAVACMQHVAGVEETGFADFVIAGDVVYGNEQGVWGALQNTLKELVGPSTNVVICHTWRYEETEQQFFRDLEECFTVQILSTPPDEVQNGGTGPDLEHHGDDSRITFYYMRKKET